MLVLRMSLWESALTLAPTDYAGKAGIAAALAGGKKLLENIVRGIEQLGGAEATLDALIVVRAVTEGISLEEAKRIELARWVD